MKPNLAGAVIGFIALAQIAMAGPFEPTKLEPLRHATASLVIVGPDGTENAYTPAQLEEFATYSLTTTTPWREVPARFEGVMLADILAAHGLDAAAAIRITAENDYSTTMTRELLDSVDVLVATRVDGQPHNRRERGPIQFVLDDDTYASSPLTTESNYVWMAARIEIEN